MLSRKKLFALLLGMSVLALNPGAGLAVASDAEAEQRLITLTARGTDIVELFEMLSKKERTNIILTQGVRGDVSINLYRMSLDAAIRAIAHAGGYTVHRRDDTYIIDMDANTKRYRQESVAIKTLKVQYSDAAPVMKILQQHLTDVGKITALDERNLIVVEDTLANIARIESLLDEIDVPPTQILIEARVLEISLDNTQSFGIDWSKFFNSQGGNGTFGAQGLATGGSQGFFFNLVTPNIEVFLDALQKDGKVNTLSSPKLLALENQESSVVIGDRIGYKLTTTINQVTTESIDFLESGVILKVTPAIDASGRIMMKVHPEVSTGTVSDGVPSQTTTEVTTQLLAEDGQTILIGGLIKNRVTESRVKVPLLGSLPLLGRLFTGWEKISIDSETIVLITPHIITDQNRAYQFSVEKPPLSDNDLPAPL